MSPQVPEELKMGDVVVIERRGRPWRLSTVQAVHGEVVQINGGYLYSATTGWRLDATHAKGERLAPLTPDRMDYLVLAQFQKSMAGLDLTRLPAERIHALAEHAKAFNQVLRSDTRPTGDELH